MPVNLSVLQVMQEDFVEMVLEILEEHDLGPGYSSLNYLNMLPLNTLKIDKSFVDTISCNIKHEVILDILINLGQGMGLKVLAEGVETEEQYAYLRKHGCDSLQGYLLSRPLPEKEVLGLL